MRRSPSEDALRLLAQLRRIPWWIWALLAPAVILQGMKFLTGGAPPVFVVGAGAVSVVRAQDAPEGVRYRLDLRAHERPEQTATRAEETLGHWPNVIVLALDAQGIDSETEAQRACVTLEQLARHAENATAVPVVLSFVAQDTASSDATSAVESANRCWRERICARGGRRLCLDLASSASSPESIREALRAAVLDARERHEAWRASTQVGR